MYGLAIFNLAIVDYERWPALTKNATSSWQTDKYQVYAPVKEDDITFFRKIKENSKVNLDYSNSIMPPKELLFNQTETMFEFLTEESGNITPSKFTEDKTIIFGIRPCDARSFHILDKLFKSDYEDPYYLNKREK